MAEEGVSDIRYGKFFSERIEKIAVHAQQRTDNLQLLVIRLEHDVYRLQRKVNKLENQMIKVQGRNNGN